MEHDVYAQRIAEKVTAAIQAAGLSQREVAAETGIPLVTLNRRLNGHAPFTVAELYCVAVALRVSAASLYPDDSVIR